MPEPQPQRSAAPVPVHGSADQPGEPPQKKHRNPWVWVSCAVALVAVGLLIWGATTQAALNSSEEDVSDLQAQVDSESAESDAAKEVADDLAQDLGSTSDDLAATEEKLAAAEKSSEQAAADEAAAKQDAEQAQNATEKAEAESREAQAKADAAEANADAAGDCASAYVNAIGSLFEGESVRSQAPVVREELESISGQCQSALSGE